MANNKRRTTSLVLAALTAMPTCDAFAFAPPHKFSSTSSKTALHAKSSNQDDNMLLPLAKQAAGGVTTFLAGLGLAAQVAFADPSTLTVVTPINGRFSCSTKF